MDRLRLERYVPIPKRWRRSGAGPEKQRADMNLGQRLARVLEELGPTYIKLGQMMSTRPDLIPPDIIIELVKLQDRVPPFDTVLAKQTVAENLGAPVTEFFEEFDDIPFASGSIAQVHRAKTRPLHGRPSEHVVIKVKRPDIEDMVRLDMSILRWISDLAERLIPELHVYQPLMIVDEFERNMIREMDFINEAATIGRFAEAFGGDLEFRVPRVLWHLTGPGALTLEELHGISAQILLSNPDPQVDNRLLAEKLARAFVKQYFEIGLFHADPHPGNLLIEPPAKIRLIDFGLTGRLDDDMLGKLVIALVAAFNREPELVVEVLADMDALGDETDRQSLRHALLQLIEKYYGLPLYRFDMETLFYEVTDVIRKHDVSLPRDFVMFGKSMVAVGGLCLQLDPDLDLVELTRPRLQEILAKRFAPSRTIKSAAIAGWHLGSILRTAPGQLRDITRRLARGRWQINIRHQNLDMLAHELDRSSNRLSFAIVIGSVIVGSSMVITAPETLTLLGIPLPALGLVGYILAGIMGLSLVLTIIRSGRVS